MAAKRNAHELDTPRVWLGTIVTLVATAAGILYSSLLTKADRLQVDELQKTVQGLLVQTTETKERAEDLRARVEEIKTAVHRVEAISIGLTSASNSLTNPSQLSDPSPANGR